jgi:adenosylmethionine-8-amino-7-oxononanoate aminotransferase
VPEAAPDLYELARAHTWGHFSQPVTPGGHPLVIERGEGPYLWDLEGRRYLDGLAGLYTVQIGHGRRELAEVAADPAARLAYYPFWAHAHPPGIQLSARLAALAPGDLDRVFLTTGGSDAVETAWKLARQHFALRGQPGRYKVVSRYLAYHGTTLGALTITGLPPIRAPFEPLAPGGIKVPNTNHYRPALCPDEGCDLSCAEAIEAAIVDEGPDTVAAVFLEPVQNAGGCFTPPEGYFARVREICDRHGVLLVSDEVICGFGRLGHWFGAERYGYQPDMITVAKGLTSGYSPLGAVIVGDRIAQPFLDAGEAFQHGLTFGGHPVSCAVALANLDVIEREDLNGHVLAHEDELARTLDDLRDLPIVGDVRGAGYFWAIELVTDQATKGQFDAPQRHRLLREVLGPRLLELGLICRQDDRGDAVIQLSPTLVCGSEQIDEIGRALRTALIEAMAEMDVAA